MSPRSKGKPPLRKPGRTTKRVPASKARPTPPRPSSPRSASTARNSPSWIPYVVGGAVVLILLWVATSVFLPRVPPLFPSPTSTATFGPTATWTPSPTATLSPDLTRVQLEYTVAHYTKSQTVQVKCTLFGCKKTRFHLTLFTEELLADKVRAELVAQDEYAPDAFRERLADLKTRLNMDEQLVFSLALSPAESGLFAKNEELVLGPFQQNMVLLTRSGEEYIPLDYDAVLDQPLDPETIYKGYVFFPRKNEAGQLFEEVSALTIQLKLNDSLAAKRSNVLWTFDLLNASSRITLTPAPTAGPTPTPGPPTPTPVVLIDREVIMAVLELLTEFARRPAGP